MAITILNSINSFIRFNETAPAPYCIWGDVSFCLPVFDQSDVQFQFVIQGTQAEIDALCTLDGSGVEVSLVSECEGTPLIVFDELPQRFRLSDTQVLYNWQHGFPGFYSFVAVKECFKIQITVSNEVYGNEVFCSNCFERIGEDCFTSVIEYGNDEDGFGFKYCDGGDIEGEVSITCEPTIVQFINVGTLAIPYTAGLRSKYGNFPTVQVWIYDGMGQLIKMEVTIAFDAYPPTMINLDFGGLATGYCIIR